MSRGRLENLGGYRGIVLASVARAVSPRVIAAPYAAWACPETVASVAPSAVRWIRSGAPCFRIAVHEIRQKFVFFGWDRDLY